MATRKRIGRKTSAKKQVAGRRAKNGEVASPVLEAAVKAQAAQDQLRKATEEEEQRVIDRVERVLEEAGYRMVVGVIQWEGSFPVGVVRYVPKREG